MNLLAFALLAWAALGAEWGLRDAFQLGTTSIAPSFVFVLLVYVALWASPASALWAGLTLGVLLDLLFQLPTTRGIDTVVVGANALGCVAASYLVVNMRAMLFRRNLLTAPLVTLVAMAVAQVIAVSVLSLRDAYDAVEFGRPGVELLERLGSAGATAALAVVLTPVLALVRPLMGFPESGRGGFRVG